MPTHVLRLVAEGTTKEDGVLTPIHDAWAQVHWAGMDAFTDSTPMEIYTTVTAKPQYEVAHGDLPVVDVPLHNIYTAPHIIQYIYQRDPVSLLQQFLGAESKTYAEKYAHAKQSREMLWDGWEISQRMGAEVQQQTLEMLIQCINDMAENASTLGMEDSQFWWVLTTAYRIIMDALIYIEGNSCSPPVS
jgi:hypothetical protein